MTFAPPRAVEALEAELWAEGARRLLVARELGEGGVVVDVNAYAVVDAHPGNPNSGRAYEGHASTEAEALERLLATLRLRHRLEISHAK